MNAMTLMLIVGAMVPRTIIDFPTMDSTTVTLSDGSLYGLVGDPHREISSVMSGGTSAYLIHLDLEAVISGTWSGLYVSLSSKLQLECEFEDSSQWSYLTYGMGEGGHLWQDRKNRRYAPWHLYQVPVPKIPLRSMFLYPDGVVALTRRGRILRWPTLHESPRLRQIKPKKGEDEENYISKAPRDGIGYTLSRRRYSDYAVNGNGDALGIDTHGELRMLAHIDPELPAMWERLRAGGERFTRVWSRRSEDTHTRLSTFCVLTESKAMRCANARGAYLERPGPYRTARCSDDRLALLTEAGEIEMYSVTELEPVTTALDGLIPAPPQRFAEIMLDTGHLIGILEDRRGTIAWCRACSWVGVNVEAPLKVQAGSSQRGCGVLANGRIICWGDNERGRMASPGWHAYDIAAGDLHGCALRSYDHQAVCWGDNTYGQSDPLPGIWEQIEAMGAETCGIRPNGVMECWGEPLSPASDTPWVRYDARPVWRPKYWPKPVEGWPELR